MLQKFIFISLTILSLISVTLADKPPFPVPNLASKKEKQKAEKLPPCKSCKNLANSFSKGLERTARGKHEGGDAKWEEEKLGSYRTSELRLVEIQELLCRDTIGEDQCHALAEHHEHDIEEWWFKHQSEHPDFFNWFCVERIQVCCQDNHFGPDCLPCSDCFGNGKCKGNGTRKGNGKCACDRGYSGEQCDSCDTAYYEAFRDESKLLCTPCHASCDKNGCTGPGPKNCRACNEGWVRDLERGCTDVDECVAQKTPCKRNQFCVNNEGSFSCLECDKSCNGCNGDGPDLCIKCADGFELRDNMCTDLTNENRDKYVNLTRYITYFGLCLATCIIFQSSTWLAATVGLLVACYITLSEYWLQTTPQPKTVPQQVLDAAMNMP